MEISSDATATCSKCRGFLNSPENTSPDLWCWCVPWEVGTVADENLDPSQDGDYYEEA